MSKNGNKDGVTVIIEKGGDVNSKNIGGQSPLHSAAGYNKIGAVKVLLEKNSNPNAKDDMANTPLHLATRCGSVILLKALIEKGAKVNEANKAGFTSMHVAAQHGMSPLLKYLHSKGGNLTHRIATATLRCTSQASVGFLNAFPSLFSWVPRRPSRIEQENDLQILL